MSDTSLGPMSDTSLGPRLEKLAFELVHAAMPILREMSPIKLWAFRRCDFAGAATTQELFQSWQDWCNSHQVPPHDTEASFAKSLRAALPHLKHVRPSRGHRRRVYLGIRLKNEA